MLLLQKNNYNNNDTSVVLLTDFLYNGLTCSNIDLGLSKKLYSLVEHLSEDDIIDYIALQKVLCTKLDSVFNFNTYLDMSDYETEFSILYHKLKQLFVTNETNTNSNLMEYVVNSTNFYYFTINGTIFLISSQKELNNKNIRTLNSKKLGRALLESLYKEIGYNELHSKSSLSRKDNCFALFNVIDLLSNE